MVYAKQPATEYLYVQLLHAQSDCRCPELLYMLTVNMCILLAHKSQHQVDFCEPLTKQQLLLLLLPLHTYS